LIDLFLISHVDDKSHAKGQAKINLVLFYGIITFLIALASDGGSRKRLVFLAVTPVVRSHQFTCQPDRLLPFLLSLVVLDKEGGKSPAIYTEEVWSFEERA